MTHRPRKRFGQHFLSDPNIIDRIVQCIDPQPTDRIVEIGPGLGALTLPILQHVERIDVIELDRDVIPRLIANSGDHPGLQVHQGDILKFDIDKLSARGPLRVIGNLPYNISTAILFHLLGYREHIVDMHFMLQKEVVDRITASPGGHEYGRLSVMMQTWCECTSLLHVSAGCFTPPPKVESAVIRLVPGERYASQVLDHRAYAELVRTAFAQRRKTLRNTLRSLCSAEQISAAGIDPGVRAEQLGIEQFLRLHHVLLDHTPAQ